MSDAVLFGIGCGITFLFLAGAYVLFRAEFTRTGKGESPSTAGG